MNSIAEQRSPVVARWALTTLAVMIVVILWGAYVRATGSGAGCGNHWPLCNGVIIPPSPSVHTLIELTHRISSGLALVLVLVLVWLSHQHFPPRHDVRVAAWVTLGVMLLEAAIGAGLVKFELVADDDSVERALVLSAHLINTLLLLGAIGFTWWRADGRPAPRLRGAGMRGWCLGGAVMALVAVGVTGAITSLGDTLFPADSLAHGMAQDRDPSAHFLLRLRTWHPILAVLTGAGLIGLALKSVGWQIAGIERAARSVITMVLIQWTIGLATLLLLVPVPLQLVHLAAADVLWLLTLKFAATALSTQSDFTTAISNRAASASNTDPAPSST